MHTRAFAMAVALGLSAGAVHAQDSRPHGGAQSPDVLKVALFDFPPFQIVPPSGPSSGFAVDIVRAVARRAGFEIRFVRMPSGTLVEEALEDSAVDVLPNVGILPARDSLMDFSRPVYTSRVRIFVRAGTTGIDDTADLVGRRVGVVRRNSGTSVLDRVPGAVGSTYDSPDDAVSALIAGQVDAMIYPESMLWTVASDLGLQSLVKMVGPPVLEVPRALAVRQGDQALLARLDPAIDALLADPEYAEIVRRWFVDPPSYWTVRRILTWTAVLLALLVVAHYLRVWHLNQRLVRSRDQLRALTAHIRTLQEDEQRLLARELHDEIGQAMAVLKMDLAQLRDHEHDRRELEQRYDAMVAVANSAIEVGHRICTRLRPDVLDRLGLAAAAEWAVGDFEARAGIPCTIDVRGCDRDVDPDVATAFFRVLQEALANVIRHAEADSVQVRLDMSGDPLRMEVEDDGRGAARNELDRPDALGVLGMRERAAALAGRLAIRAAEDGGTLVCVEIPRVRVHA